ncbi:uncharacterized protein [Procambarus clarkii]|uniref:uncharacterized protein isoform X2 n=1 Tax=Procambarus clarkii TaxID=6728 RepID=UPI003743AE55
MSSSVLVLMVMVIGVTYGMGVPLDEHGANKTKAEWERLWTVVPLARSGSTVGNLVYSVAGFLLGGVLLFVSLFDPTRKPVIKFFDNAFGERSVRQRREVGTGLESHVAVAFDAFTAALDKMEVIAKMNLNYL